MWLLILLAALLFGCSEPEEPAFSATSSTDLWLVSQAKVDGKPALIRRNESARELAGKDGRKHQAGILIKLLDPNVAQLPGKDEADRLDAIERALADEFGAHGGTEALVLTSQGVRQYIFYTSDKDAVDGIVLRVQKRFPEHKLERYVTYDPKWRFYQDLSAGNPERR